MSAATPPHPPSPPTPPRPDAELQRLRAEMDALNDRLVAVLHDRARLCRRIAAHKRTHGLPPADPARERAMLDRLLAATGDGAPGFSREALERLLLLVFAESRRIVEQAR